MDNIVIGKVVGTHGIKGEIKVISEFDRKDKAFMIGNIVSIKNQSFEIEGIRHHKIYELIKFKGFDNINDVLYLKNENLYINRNSLKLDNDEYLLNDLIGSKVYDEDLLLGNVTDIVKGVSNNCLRINNEFLIPFVESYIKDFDKSNKILHTINTKDFKNIN